MFELRDIHAGYETGKVLQGVDLTVPDNAVVALLGPNGAGKTTLLRVASGLLRPTSGQILIDGKDFAGQPPEKLAQNGVVHVPEGRGVFPGMTVAENLRLQADAKIDRKAVKIAANRFPKLGQRVNQLAGTMSGGEQQMLALAHAYVTEPAVVLLDEVSMGLAPKIVDEIFEYLRDLANSGTSLLLVEQYVSRALALADFVYILNRGRVAFAGEPGELGADAVAAAYLGELAS